MFYFYYTVFRGGDFDKWLTATLRTVLVFLTFKWKNYDKATLCQLSDVLYHCTENQALANNIKMDLNAFTENEVNSSISFCAKRFVQNNDLPGYKL